MASPKFVLTAAGLKREENQLKKLKKSIIRDMTYLTTLTRIPFGPNSSAKHLVNMSNALFDIQ
jgi:hypothetical protein